MTLLSARALSAASLALVLSAVTATTVARGQPAEPAGAAGERIVSVGGAVTEILYALGLEGRIAAVDTTSLEPARALRDKPNVGYIRALSAEGVLSLQPSLVITTAEAGPPAAVKLVEEAGVRVARVPDEASPEGIVGKITTIGRLTGADEAARTLANATQARFAALAAARARIDTPVRAIFVLALQNGRPLVAGRGTAADGILRLAGADNVASGFDGYKPMTDEAIIAAAPDVVVMMDREGHRANADEVFAAPALAATPAAARRALVAMEGLYLLGFGPRTPDAARDLMRALYPTLSVPALPPLPGAAAR